MRWEDERYVRLYTRDTPEWLALSLQAQGLFALLLRKVDRAGILNLGKLGRRAVAVVIGHAGDWERLEPALSDLLADGCVEIHGDSLVVPNFIAAQSAAQSDKARQAECRARARDLARAPLICAPVTNRDPESRTVTIGHETGQNVTSGHTVSQRVTPNCAVPSLTEVEASPESSATPPPPPKAKRAKRVEVEATDSSEPLRLRLVAFIRSQGVPYVEAVVEERTQLKRALKAPDVTEATIEAAYRTVYARGAWHPTVRDVARVLTAASERPRGRGGAGNGNAPAPVLRDLKGIDDEGMPIYQGGANS
jgi:hypothetical protein